MLIHGIQVNMTIFHNSGLEANTITLCTYSMHTYVYKTPDLFHSDIYSFTDDYN